MMSHDGYRALAVFAMVLVHMHGTLAVRTTSNVNKRNGESSSLLWFSRSASFSLSCLAILSSSSAFAICPVLVFFRRERPLPPGGHARAPLAAPPSSFHLLPPSSSSRRQHVPVFISDPLTYTLVFPGISSTMRVIYFILVLFLL